MHLKHIKGMNIETEGSKHRTSIKNIESNADVNDKIVSILEIPEKTEDMFQLQFAYVSVITRIQASEK